MSARFFAARRHFSRDAMLRLLQAATRAAEAGAASVEETAVEVDDPCAREIFSINDDAGRYARPARTRVRLVIDFEPEYLTAGAANDEPRSLPSVAPALPAGPIDAEFIDDEPARGAT